MTLPLLTDGHPVDDGAPGQRVRDQAPKLTSAMRPWVSYCPSPLPFPHLKVSDGPHHLSGPFWPKESMIFWCFEHCPALGDLPEKVLSFAAASYHWDHSLLRLLRNISAACSCFCIARSSDRQTPSSSAPGPTDSKPERSLHFLSAYDSVLYH